MKRGCKIVFKFINRFVASIITLVVFSDGYFEGTRPVQLGKLSKVKLIETTIPKGGGVLILGVVAVGIYKMVDPILGVEII